MGDITQGVGPIYWVVVGTVAILVLPAFVWRLYVNVVRGGDDDEIQAAVDREVRKLEHRG